MISFGECLGLGDKKLLQRPRQGNFSSHSLTFLQGKHPTQLASGNTVLYSGVQ